VPTAPDDVALLLRRAGFGATRAEVANLTGLDVATIVDQLLDTSMSPPVVPPPELANTTLSTGQQITATTLWWLERMRTTPTPLQEKMALFWHGHFVSAVDKVNNASVMFGQNQIFRTMGLGSFRALSQAVAVDPAMLVYLDNWQNVVGAQNENFAREYMELFSLGVNQYTQDDVVAAARAWTGHGLNATRTAYVFTAARHDNGTKTFFGTAKNWNGPDIIDEICTGQKEAITARFIAKKLWSFFAYPNPETQVLDDLTAAFLASTDLDVTALLRAIFTHPRFFSATTRAGLVRTPTDYVVAAVRHAGLTADAPAPQNFMPSMNQQLFYPPNVAGWQQNTYWLGTSAETGRASYARAVATKAAAAGVLAGVPNQAVTDAVQAAFDQFGVSTPAATTRAALEQWLTAERAAKGTAQAVNLMTLVLLSPDFQLA
jgi:uncharacterized protein (DUF1800 family)